jgi:predicted peptidase
MIQRALLALGFIAIPALARHPKTGFLNRTVSVSGTEYRYQVFLPADWTNKQKWPVILFLHGSGERGDDGVAQAQVGIGSAIRLHPERFPAVVVMPQCRNGERWTDPDMEAMALAALDRSMKEFHGDADQVFLSGLSMGGYASWDLAAKYPGKWAAAVIICGGIRRRTDPPISEQDTAKLYAEAAGKIGAKLPIWVFHGGADGTVPVEESRKMVEALKALGSKVKYTEYAGVEHNSWDKAYAEPDLPAWLFAQHLAQHRSGLTSGT